MVSTQNAVLQENDVAMRSVFQQQRLAQCLQQRRRVQFLESALRNPGAADGQQGRLFIGFAAAELLGLLAFVVAMILIFVA